MHEPARAVVGPTPRARSSQAMSDAALRFVGIANGRYAALPALTRAGPDTADLAALLRDRHGGTVQVLADLTRGALLDAIDEHLASGSAAGASLIVSWTGHGRIGADGTLRLVATNGREDVDIAAAGQLGEWAARTGARQVLVVIDTCYSGGGLADATRVALAVDAGRSTPGAAWFGVVAASQADEPSRSGALAAALRRLLTSGPRLPDFRWDRTRPYIRGDDLAQALLADWDEPRHTPHAMSFGRAWDLVRNPMHEEGLRDQPLEHLLLAARGGGGPQSFFTGREEALGRLVAWLAEARPGLFVLTGPPGCGKSAILGRLVSLSAHEERARLLGDETVPPALDPGEGSVDAQLQMRGTTVETASDELARQLHLPGTPGLFGVLAAARERRLAGRPLVVAVDGLDEAREFSRDLVTELMLPLSREALVMVATRELALGETTLLRELSREAEVLDLGRDPAGTLHDVRRYVQRRLLGVHPAMDPARVAEAVAQQAETSSAAPFLLARLVSSQLRDQPVDTGREGWQLALATTVENALERDLHSVVLVVGGQPQPEAARELLAALAMAFGAGFPADDVWPAVASATSRLGLRYGRDEVYALIAAMGRHLVAGNEAGQPVYRIAHQQLVDYLAADAQRAARDPELAALRTLVGGAVSRAYQEVLDAGLRPQDHAYLWRHAWRHLALAGTPGLQALERLVERDREAFLPDLAAALELAGAQAWARAQPQASLDLHGRAVALWRDLGERRRLAKALFQLAVARSSVGDDAGADDATEEAVAIAHGLQDQPQGQLMLATALVVRALAQLREGSVHAARRLAGEAIAMAESAAGTVGGEDADGAHQLLAGAWVAAAQAASVAGDIEAAVAHAERAVAQCDAIAPPGAERLRLVRLEALATLAAAQYLRAHAAAPDAQGRRPAADTRAGERVRWELHQPGTRAPVEEVTAARGLMFLARARWLNRVLGLAPDTTPRDIDEPLDEGLALTRPHAARMVEAAVALGGLLHLRSLVAASLEPPDVAAAQAALDEAAAALAPFAGHSQAIGGELGLVMVGRVQIAMQAAIAAGAAFDPALLAQSQEALAWLRPSPALPHRQALAQALGQLALLQAGSPEGPDAATRAEAIEVWRELAAQLPDARPQLAMQLIDQSASLLEGRTAEAVDAAREAADIAATLPPPQSDLVRGFALVNLGGALVALEMPQGAEAPLDEALRLLAPSDQSPIVRAALANAHLSLARIALQGAQAETARVHAQKAVDLFDSPGIPPYAGANRILATVLLAQARRASGDAAADASLRQTVDALRQAALAGQSEGLLVYALNAAAPELWDEVLPQLAERPDLQRRCRLLRRRPADELDLTVRELAEELARAGGAGHLEVREVREIVRHHRALAPAAFDDAWRRVAGTQADWLHVDPRLMHTVFAWWNTPSWQLSRRYLQAHPELLQPDIDTVLDELGLEPGRRPMAMRHRQIVDDARRVGLDAAYAALLLDEEIRAWLSSRERQEYLEQHGELMRPEMLDALRARADAGDAQCAVLHAVLELSRRGERRLAFEAMEAPSTLVDTLRTGWRGGDAARQRLIATIVWHVADDAPTRAPAAAALLIANAIESSSAEPDPALLQALHAADDGHGLFVAAVADAMLAHPRSAGVLGQLMAGVGTAPPAAATPVGGG